VQAPDQCSSFRWSGASNANAALRVNPLVRIAGMGDGHLMIAHDVRRLELNLRLVGDAVHGEA
jgi:hypothetical protein